MSNFNSTFNIKDYVVDRRRIGKGSFSTIYKCSHNVTDKTFALKEITIDKNKNKNKLNIKREFEIMRKLNHENIVKIHDVIIDTQLNNIYFIMDYYEYGDLSNFLKKQPLKEKFTRKYMKQLSNGLKYLLDNNILHRDLKPQNILLSKNYDVKITDFGFATYYTKDTIINTLCGSPMYMAPEIITKNGYDYKSDLWSVGIILYEMLHGHTPFNVQNFIELIKEIKKKNITINVDVSEECKELIYSLCKTNPNERIGWNDFFAHKWFDNDEIIHDENTLFNVSFNSSLPNINKYNINEKQFCSFRHKSITEKDHNLEFKFLEDSYDDDEDLEEESNSDDYVSADEDYKSLNESLNESSNNNELDVAKYADLENELSFVEVVKPIDIPTKNIDIPTKNIDIPTKNIDIPTKNIDIPTKNNEFIFINPKDMNTISLPNKKKTITDSFREYLYSSMKILKYSYDYMSNNSI
jgi:serine/threonine protein kinase